MWIFIAITGLLQIASILTACPTGLPSGCTCSGSSYLYMTCNMTGKTTWPNFNSALSPIQFYRVTYRGPGKIQVLTAEALQYINTISLYIQYLGIEEVHQNAFKTSPDRLRTLNMNYNNLLYFPSTAISSLSSRQYLYIHMRYNNITSLDATWLPDNINILYLSNNYIRNINPNFFHDTNQIRYLDLSHNYIEDNDVQAILKLKQLYSLKMNHNSLRNFRSLDSRLLPISLQSLYLSNNDIRNIDPNIFHVNNTIYSLDLSHNYLEDEDVQAILKLKKLTTLQLGHNLLTTSSLDLLYKLLRNKRYLTLEMNNNYLTTKPFSRNLLLTTPYSFFLDLSHNKLPDFPDINVIINRSYTLVYIDLSDNNIQHIPQINSSCYRKYYYAFFRINLNLNRNMLHGQNSVVSHSNCSESVRYKYQLEYNQINILTFSIYGDVELSIHASHNMLTKVPTIAVKSNGTNSQNYFHVYMNVRNNTITRIDNIYKILTLNQITTNYVNLYAEDNPLHCDCAMSWIRNSTYTTLHSSTCQSPEELCGYYVGCFPLTGCHSNQSTSSFQQFCTSSPNTTCVAENEVTQTATPLMTDGTSKMRTETTNGHPQVTGSTITSNITRSNTSSTGKIRSEDTQLRTVLAISLPLVIGLTLITASVVGCFIYRRRRGSNPPPPSRPETTTTVSMPTVQESPYVNQGVESVYSNECFQATDNVYETLNTDDVVTEHERHYNPLRIQPLRY